MKTPLAAALFLGIALLSSAAPGQVMRQPLVRAESLEAQTVDAATQVLNEIMAIPARSIPQAMLRDAEGLVIVPRLLKGGFVVGIRHGRGVLVVKDATGAWTGPSFVTVTGGSVGWQAGVQATDIILVLASRKSLEGLERGKFTLGADVAAAAGPVGREAAAATDAALGAEIYTYSRSRGLFAGVALDGSAIQIDRDAAARYYATYPTGAGVEQSPPPSAQRLLNTVATYATGKPVASTGFGPQIPPTSPPAGAPTTAAPSLREELVESSMRLHGLLDGQWQVFLALPAEVYEANATPTAEGLRSALDRFKKVAAEPQYQDLARRPEFQQTYTLLKRYAAGAAPSTRLALPPPPK